MRSDVMVGAWAVLVIGACGDTRDAPDVDASQIDASVVDAATSSAWRSEPAVPERIQEITGAVHGGRLWIAGGLDASGATSSVVRIFDPDTSTWSEGPPLPRPRHHAMMVSTGEDLYVIGGMETLEFDPLETAWVLREGASAWEEIAPLPEGRGAGIAGVIGDRIVVAGGNATRGGLATSTLRYDVANDRWDAGAAIPTEREHLGGFVHDGQLWVIAGRRNSLSTNTDVVELYDPIADTWRPGPSIPTRRGGFGIAVLDGTAYAVGGEQPDRALDSVEALDLARETWSEIESVPTPRHGHVVLAAAGRIWVVGGGDRPTFAAVDVVESFAP
ncbi:Kelch repeat-containing protein [Sandaracinus amylolyticus]|uniref:Galactose oxidase n=1 Tax=Sandaracinus amylolyticus TaxID=927083 RepID=A0A0F6W2C4_9BACT|nr:kelch repeat-containing protein [Sandaracinus amylolyticus]AKF05471.1 Hypothetical protein DB32_002620 [Sandaracinus amylolyticus]